MRDIASGLFGAIIVPHEVKRVSTAIPLTLIVSSSR
jgi:hypothetical protein